MTQGLQDFHYIMLAPLWAVLRLGPASALRAGGAPQLIGERHTHSGFATGVLPTAGHSPRALMAFRAILRGARGR